MQLCISYYSWQFIVIFASAVVRFAQRYSDPINVAPGNSIQRRPLATSKVIELSALMQVALPAFTHVVEDD